MNVRFTPTISLSLFFTATIATAAPALVPDSAPGKTLHYEVVKRDAHSKVMQSIRAVTNGVLTTRS